MLVTLQTCRSSADHHLGIPTHKDNKQQTEISNLQEGGGGVQRHSGWAPLV